MSANDARKQSLYFPEDMLSEASRPFLALPVIFGVRTLCVPAISKGMGAGAQGDNWFARF